MLAVRGHATAAVPLIPAERIAAIVATSGSTGAPALHPKPWGTLVTCTEAAADCFGWAGPETASIVGTVPPQHMYGFETTVLLPLHAQASSYAGSNFFPYDIAQALAAVPAPRVLVTTSAADPHAAGRTPGFAGNRAGDLGDGATAGRGRV